MFFLKALSQSKYFLSAMTGMLLTGSVFAGTAGRVNFIAGDVTATTSDNTTHSLFKGDLINAGDKLETGKNSRVQIRFTDGSILSLKQNSTFSVEKYSFSKDTPEQGSVLFNFVRGGFRTISGAIGKVNRMNYRMNTPFATIGIRGTDYSASLNDDKVFVTVMDGKVNISNDFGNSDVSVGESYVVGDKSMPTLCHIDELSQTKEGSNSISISQPCSPVLVPLEAEDGFYISKLKVKKPILETFKSYGDYAEALRRYNALVDEINQASSEVVSSLTLIDEKNTLISSNAHLTQIDINRNNSLNRSQLFAGALDAKEMRESSVINDFMQLYSPLNLVDSMDSKDLLKQSLPIKASDSIAINTLNNGLDKKLNENIGLIFSSVFNATIKDFLGFNSSIIGADFGKPDIYVKYGDKIFNGIYIDLSPALKNKNELIGLGVLQSDLLGIDANNNDKLRGFSFRQGLIHDNDGVGVGRSRNSGSVVIGDGSIEQSTVIFTDETTPISVNLSLGNGAKVNVSDKTILDINIATPKLAIKVGDIYVSGSDSSAENIDKDGNDNFGAPAVLGTSQDGATPIKIMGSSEIVLGAAKISVKLEHNTENLRNHILDGIELLPTMSILANAFIQDGVTINHLDIRDSGGRIKGGGIMMSSLKISDYNSNDLSAIINVNVTKPTKENPFEGLLLTLKKLGDSANGIDLTIKNLRVGSNDAREIGDIEVKGLNVNGIGLLLSGK